MSKVNLVGWARELLAKRAIIVAVVSLILSTAVDQGWIGIDVSNSVLVWVNKGFILVSLLVTVLITRGKITPVDDPMDNEGRKLEPAKGVPFKVTTNINATPVTVKETNELPFSNL